MGTSKLPTKNQILNALQSIKSQSSEEDAIEGEIICSDIDGIEDIIDIEVEDERISGILSLAKIPLEEWIYLSVSPLSQFGDNQWDFTSYPHTSRKQAVVNFDYNNYLGINLTDKKYTHWQNISKAILFYSAIPHFSMLSMVRSYGTISSKRSQIIRLIALFQQESLYLGDHRSNNFRTIDDLSPDTVSAFIEQSKTAGIKWESAFILQFWQKISKAGLLPKQYTVFGTYVSKEYVARKRAEYDATATTFLPIPLDDYAQILNHCISVVVDYSDDVIWLYKTYYPTLVGAFEHTDRLKLNPFGFSTGSKEGVEAFKAYTPALINEVPWWPLRVYQRTHSNDQGEYVSYSQISSCIASLIDACCTLIMAPTGMRRSEVMGLRVNCISQDDAGYWLNFDVFKTSNASQGDVNRIPVPAITAKAVYVLEKLFSEARTYGCHDYLFVTITRQHFGNRTHVAYPERAVKRVAEAAGAECNIHPHQFRKSLAMYLIYQDPRNIEIIRKLFSHKSLKMTLRYVLSLPSIHTEIRNIIIDQNVDILVELLDGVFRNRIGGIGGKRTKETIENSARFKAKLQDGGKETVTQYVESLLDQGIKLLHRTNLAICMKTPSVTEPAPCEGKNENPAAKLHPNLFACDPFNCRFAAFMESSIPLLKNEIMFHNNLIRHPYCSDKQKAFSERRIKDAFTALKDVNDEEAKVHLQEVING